MPGSPDGDCDLIDLVMAWVSDIFKVSNCLENKCSLSLCTALNLVKQVINFNVAVYSSLSTCLNNIQLDSHSFPG